MDDWLDAGTQAVLSALDQFDVPQSGDPTGMSGYRPGGSDPTGMNNWRAGGTDPTGLSQYSRGMTDPTGLGQFSRGGTDPTGMNTYRFGGSDPTGLGQFTRGGQDPTGLGQFTRNGQDPTGLGTNPFGPGIDPVMANMGANQEFIDIEIAKWQASAQQAAGTPMTPTGQGAMSGSMGNPADGAKPWSEVNKWNNEIARAIAQVQTEEGVAPDGNRIKAHMMIESEGYACMADQPRTRGLMQMTIKEDGSPNTLYAADWNRLGCVNGQPVDPAYQIYAGVKELTLRYKGAPGATPDEKWRAASCAYFTGNYTCQVGFDLHNGTTVQQYDDAMDRYMALLGSGTQQTYTTGNEQLGPGGEGLGGFGTGYAPYTQGVDHRISQPFNNYSGSSMYAYVVDYGLPYGTHAGTDIAGDRGEPITTPIGGVVTCAGSDNGPGTEGRGCAKFADTDGGGAGRVEILGDDGRAYIFGHSATSTVQVGQRVTPGQQVATMGGMNGTHLHMEVHQKGNCGSGWCAVDAATAYTGGYTTSPGGGTTPGGAPSYAPNQAPYPGYGYPGGSNASIADYFASQPGWGG